MNRILVYRVLIKSLESLARPRRREKQSDGVVVAGDGHKS